METQLFCLLDFIAHKQFQLENIRQLLCEEVTFNLHDAFQYLKVQQNCQNINIYGIQHLLGNQTNTTVFESIVKFYSKNNLNLTLQQFAQMILTRQDQLLSKLTREREQTTSHFPQYIVSYLQKLFVLQNQIHTQLTNIRIKRNKMDIKRLLKYKKDLNLDLKLLKHQFIQFLKQENQNKADLYQQLRAQLVFRYLKKGIILNQLSFTSLTQLFIVNNCALIQNYLKVKENDFNNEVVSNKLRVTSPLVHKQFKKLKKYNQIQKQDVMYCYRQIISVETHINRNKKKIPSSSTVKAKIGLFSKFTQQKMKIFFKYLNKMIKISIQIHKIKGENMHQQTFLIYQLYQEITKNDFMIPSQLKNYIQKTGFSVELNAIFVFFKRYANPITGKLSKRQFSKIFKTHSLEQKVYEKISLNLQDRRKYINIILHQILLQCKIQKYKLIFEQKEVDMRQVFNVIDVDGKGKISKTDIQVEYTKITGQKLKNQDLIVLWKRMGKKTLFDYILYDQFMLEMLPKTKNQNKKIQQFCK